MIYCEKAAPAEEAEHGDSIEDRREKTTDAEIKIWMLRLFAGSWALITLLVARLSGELPPVSAAGVLLCIVALLFATGLTRPDWMRRPYRLVDRLLAPVGQVVAFLMLALVYFTVFSVFSIVLRLLRWDPLRLRRSHWPASGWIDRSCARNAADYRWQY